MPETQIVPKSITVETFAKADRLVTPNRGLVFETDRQRNVAFINKGISKPGAVSYDVLRRAANSVHIARICVNVLKEKVSKTKWVIKPIDPQQAKDDKKDPRIKEVTDLFKHPNKNDETFRTLLDKMLEDLYVLDSVAVEKTRDSKGNLEALHFVDAATVRPVFDEYGNQDVEIPIPTLDGQKDLPVSYVQVMQNSQFGGPESGEIVAAWPKKDFLYFHMHPQGAMEGIGYGLSPLEGVLSVVANILNADNYNGTYFEEGSFPPVIIQILGQVNQRDIEAYRQYLQTELMGNFHRPAIMAGGQEAKVLNLKDLTNRDMEFMEYMKFMARLLAAAYGLAGQDIGLTDDLNKAISDTQQDLSNQKGYGSTLHLLKEVFNQEIIWKDFGYEDLEFDWVSDDSTPLKDAVDIYQKSLQSGIMTVNEARTKMGMEPFEAWADEPMVLTGSGYVPIQAPVQNAGDNPEEHDDSKPEGETSKDVGGEKKYSDQKAKPVARGKVTEKSRMRKFVDGILKKGIGDISLEDFKTTPAMFGELVTEDSVKNKVRKVFKEQDTKSVLREYNEVAYSYHFVEATDALKSYILKHPRSVGGLLPQQDERGIKYTVFVKDDVLI
jgi:phage portal protein BeeE